MIVGDDNRSKMKRENWNMKYKVLLVTALSRLIEIRKKYTTSFEPGVNSRLAFLLLLMMMIFS